MNSTNRASGALPRGDEARSHSESVSTVHRMPTVPVTLRLTREQLKTAERLASRSGVRYQTVLKKLITDGLSSWERAGRLKNWC